MKKAKWWLLPLSIVVMPLTFMVVLIRGLIGPSRLSTIPISEEKSKWRKHEQR